VFTARYELGLYIQSRLTLMAESRLRSRANPFEFCGGHASTGTRFTPSSSASLSTSATHSSSSTCSYQKVKLTNPTNLPKSNALSKKRATSDTKVLSSDFKRFKRHLFDQWFVAFSPQIHRAQVRKFQVTKLRGRQDAETFILINCKR